MCGLTWLCASMFCVFGLGWILALALFTKAIILTAMCICFASCLCFIPFYFVLYIKFIYTYYFLSKIIESDTHTHTQFLIWMQSMHVYTVYAPFSCIDNGAERKKPSRELKCYCPPHFGITAREKERNRVQSPNQQCEHWNTENYCGTMREATKCATTESSNLQQQQHHHIFCTWK